LKVSTATGSQEMYMWYVYVYVYVPHASFLATAGLSCCDS